MAVALEYLQQNVLRKKIGQYGFALGFKLSRERSKKTEAVFLVGSRESEGKSKSPQALFLLPAFSFGEAKENADGQLKICTIYRPFVKLPFSSTTAEVFRFNPFGQPPAARAPAGGALCFSAVLRLASSAWMM